MSVKRFSEQLQALQTQPKVSAKDIQSLRESAGSQVSKAERALVDHFVRSHRGSLTAKAVEQVERDFSVSMPKAAKLTVLEERSIGVKEASGVAMYKGQFLMADDDRGLFVESPQGETTRLLSAKKEEGVRGLEGLTLSSDGKAAYVVSEDSRQISMIPLSQKKGEIQAGKPILLGELPKIGEKPNKGWEGIEVLPGRFSADGQDKLVAVHEGSPRAVGIFSLPDLREESIIRLPAEAEKLMKDVSDIAICPKTGHLFLLSDESARIVECALTTQRQAAPGALLERPILQILGSLDLPVAEGSKPEGITFDGADRLWVVSDGDQRMWQLRVERD
jgi:uncharacterized protein YjiK